MVSRQPSKSRSAVVEAQSWEGQVFESRAQRALNADSAFDSETTLLIDVEIQSLLSFSYNLKAMGFALTHSFAAGADDSYILCRRSFV